MASRAEEFFKQIRDIGDEAARVAFVHKIVADKTLENEYLDFKNGIIQNNEDDLKKQWSKALSGYANTGGGVLIFGIDARKKHGSKLECQSIAAVVRPDELLQRLRDFHLAATDEVVRGTDHLTIKQSDGTGFVVSLVPEGNRKPYRAMLDGSNGGTYYQRTSDNFIPIPHAMLRSLFYPQYTADFEPAFKIRTTQNSNVASHQADIEGSIINTGKRSVSSIAVLVQADPVVVILNTNGSFRKVDTAVPGRNLKTLQVVSTSPIHPGEHLPAFKASLPFTGMMGLRIRITIYLDNQEPILYSVTFGTGNAHKVIRVEGFVD